MVERVRPYSQSQPSSPFVGFGLGIQGLRKQNGSAGGGVSNNASRSIGAIPSYKQLISWPLPAFLGQSIIWPYKALKGPFKALKGLIRPFKAL